MLLDGAGGDTVLTEGRRIPRLLRAGRWGTAYREAAGQNRFWNGALPPHRELLRSARAAFVPNFLLRPPRRWRQRARIGRTLRSSPIDARFGQRIVVAERLRMLEGHSAPCPLSDAHHERARAVYHPYLTVARERYDRVAGAIGIEPRDPFLDVRVLSFLVGLPDDQLLVAGWPKAILRRATAGLLPDVVRWRRGKEHLGWAFTAALIEQTQHAALPSFEAGVASLRPYIDADAVQDLSSRVESGSAREVSEAYHLSALALWLQSHQRRPVVSNGRK